MKKAETFGARLHKHSLPLLKFPKGKKTNEELLGRFQRQWLGEKKPEDNSPLWKTSGRQKYIATLFRHYFQIRQSLDRIDQARKFIAAKNSRPRNISELDYLRYHQEYYLNETYIYHLRLDTLLNFLIKKCDRANLKKDSDRLKTLKAGIYQSLEGLIKIRGHHVHVLRYEDNKLDQLSSLDLLSKDFDFFRRYRDAELKGLKRKLASKIKRNHSTLEKLVETDLNKVLGTLVFNKLYKAQSTLRS